MTTIIFSICALTISLISLIITLVQKDRETKRTIRKNLTDTLENVTKINLETTKMRASKDIDYNSELAATIRRHFNQQRRILVAHADFLVRRYDKIATEIDCNILAGAYAIINDQELAEHFWKKSIGKSLSIPIKHMNLRGFGGYLFNAGKIDAGRMAFKQALDCNLAQTDESKLLIIETYLLLTDLEREHSKENYNKCLEQAWTVCSTIVSVRKREGRYAAIKAKMTDQLN